jgi:acetyl esterase/lipase
MKALKSTLLFLCSFPLVSVGQDAKRSPDTAEHADSRSVEGQVTGWLRMDKDGDEKLTKDESRGLMKTHFDRNDTDKDGFLTRAELEDLAKRLRRGRDGPTNNTRNTPKMSTQALLAQAPEGVTVVPDIQYREGSEACQLDLAMPTKTSDVPRPALIFVHGGGWRNGDKRTASFIDPTLEFAAKGYVCISVNYRLLGETTSIADCVADVKCAVRWLRAHAEQYNVDPQRFGAYGNSAGAHLVSMLGMCPKSAGMEGDGPNQDQSSMVQAVVASATPASFSVPMSDRAKARRQQPQRVRYEMSEETKKKVSPITYVTADAPPFLLVHEISDRTVGVYQSDKLVEALKAAGAKDVTYKRYEDGSGHGVFGKNIRETGPMREAFFDRVLREQTSSK